MALSGTGAFNRAEVLRTISDYLGRYGAQSDEIVVPEPGGPFVEYEKNGRSKKKRKAMATKKLLEKYSMTHVLSSN